MTNKKQSFESSLKRLEEITDSLDSGNVTLDEMLDFFEEGIKLTKDCIKRLDEAEQKVNLLIKNVNGEAIESPFNTKSI